MMIKVIIASLLLTVSCSAMALIKSGTDEDGAAYWAKIVEAKDDAKVKIITNHLKGNTREVGGCATEGAITDMAEAAARELYQDGDGMSVWSPLSGALKAFKRYAPIDLTSIGDESTAYAILTTCAKKETINALARKKNGAERNS